MGPHWYDVIRPYLEGLYFIASICLTASIFIAVNQLKLMKKDIQVRNHRAAVETSIQYLNMFATEFIPKVDPVLGAFKQQQFSIFDINESFTFDHTCNMDNPKTRDQFEFLMKNNVYNFLNELEYFSAALMSGLADEDLAFNPLAELFCDTIEMSYIALCFKRMNNTGSGGFNNIISLYKLWKDRMKDMEDAKELEKIAQRMANRPKKNVKPIGL